MQEQKNLRTTIYSRVSTQKQIDRTDYDSMQSHLDRCKHYIKAHGNWELIKVYEDPAESGDKWQREKLQEMLEDVRNNAIDIVVVFRLDRISRSVRQFHEILKIFEENEVNLVSVTQGFDTSTPAGKLLRNIIIDLSQFEKDMISDRIKEKRLSRAKKGLWNGGPIPLGYKSENGKLVIIPEEAKTVKMMFDVYKKTKSRTKVREELELMGTTTKSGKNFSKTSVEFILSNPIYAGKIYENGKYFDGIHEPIIDPELYFSINRMKPLIYHKTQRKKTDRVFILKGLAKCGHHGCLMTPYHVKKKNGPIYYYLCTKKMLYRNVKCPVAYANADKLENYVMERLKEIQGQKSILESIIDKVNLNLKSETLPFQKEQEEINKRITDVERQVENFLEAIATTGSKAVTTLLEKKVENFQNQLDELRKRKDELTLLIANSPSKINAQVVLDTLKEFSTLYQDLTPQEKAAYLQYVIQEVTVVEDKIDIRLHCLPSFKRFEKSNGMVGRAGRYSNHLPSLLIPYNHSILQKKTKKQAPSRKPRHGVFRKAQQYQKMLDQGVFKNRSDLARKQRVSPARITQTLSLLNLSPEIQGYLDKLSDQDLAKFSGRQLEKIAKIKDFKTQLEEFEELIRTLHQRGNLN